jgi:ribosomal protein S18 acetylase RimI-like enzyme
MSDFVIEEVTDLDTAWPDLEALFLELEAYHEPFVNRTLRSDWAPRWREFIAPGDYRLILIARQDGIAQGYAIVRFVPHDYGLFEDAYGYIHDAYVREEARSQGIGRAMLRRAEEWSRSKGADEVRLNVYAANKLGSRFWTLAGFELQSMTMRKPLTEGRG